MAILTKGQDQLAKFPDFELVGREDEYERICAILLRDTANSIFLTGIDGVGTTDLVLGLQASKSNADTASDVYSKRLFWLNTDELFAQGNGGDLNGEFFKAISQLDRAHNAILVIEDTQDFIESCRNSGSMHFLNALSMSIRNNSFQVILIANDEDLSSILKVHSDLTGLFTFLSIDEPVAEDLEKMIHKACVRLTKHHKIKINESAIKTAIELTNKYQTRDSGLSKAQPERTVTLIDRALSSYRLNAHKSSPPNFSQSDWETVQKSLRRYYREMRDAEDLMTSEEQKLEDQLKVEAGINKPDPTSASELLEVNGADSEAVRKIKARIAFCLKEGNEAKSKFDQLTFTINTHLELTKEHVLYEFSDISGISVNKLNQNELEKLKSLEVNLAKRIFGQSNVLTRLSNAVKIARVGGRNKGKPQASFLFLGSSGTGKTEVSKALAALLLDDEKALTRFDMSEYMEKHAVAKLIGAPPGYEGFEAGGILTNLMRKNGNRILLFDEIEKADPSIFNIFLQILSDGRLSDNLGRTASFSDAIIIMTTNIGQEFFLDMVTPEDESAAKAIKQLGEIYRPEFLNRFGGRQNIVPFKRLEIDSIKKIVKREFDDLGRAYAEKGIRVEISDTELHAFCSAVYNPVEGARGLPGYIETNVEPVIVNTILDHGGVTGTMSVMFDDLEKKLRVSFLKDLEQAA